MKKNIHPKNNKIIATCSCGNIIEIYSTLNKNINLDVCSCCHPFYTGKQRNINKIGRISRFKNKFNISDNI